MRLADYRATGSQRRSGVAPSHRIGQRKVAGPEYGHWPEGHVHAAQVGFGMRRTIRHSPVDAGVYPGPFPHERGEEPQLVHGTAPFPPNTAPWKPRFPAGAFDQCVAKTLDLRRDTLQKICPVGGFGGRIGVESSLSGFGGSVDIGRRSFAKHGIKAQLPVPDPRRGSLPYSRRSSSLQ